MTLSKIGPDKQYYHYICKRRICKLQLFHNIVYHFLIFFNKFDNKIELLAKFHLIRKYLKIKTLIIKILAKLHRFVVKLFNFLKKKLDIIGFDH